MDKPIEIVFHGISSSAQVETEIRHYVEKLEHRFGHLIGCRVAVDEGAKAVVERRRVGFGPRQGGLEGRAGGEIGRNADHGHSLSKWNLRLEQQGPGHSHGRN